MNNSIKPLSIIIFLFFVIGLSSCKEVDKWTQFNMDYSTSVSIPSTIGINLPFNLFSPDIKTNPTETFELNNTHKNLAGTAKLNSLILKILGI